MENKSSSNVALIDSALSIPQMKERAELLVKSGFLPKTVNTAEKAVAIMILGAEYGIPPMKAFQSIDVIDGKPALSAQLQLALCQNTKELEDLIIKHDPAYCEVTMKRKGRSAYTVRFGDVEAKSMKAREWDESAKVSRVIDLIQKYNYRTMKSVMYEWRALSRACRVVFPDAVLGLYTPDELEDIITQPQEDRLVKKAELADETKEKVEELEGGVASVAGTVHEAGADTELFMKLSASFIQDPKFYTWYPEKTLGEIVGHTTPGGRPKGRPFLERVAKESSNTTDRANVEAFLRLLDKAEEAGS